MCVRVWTFPLTATVSEYEYGAYHSPCAHIDDNPAPGQSSKFGAGGINRCGKDLAPRVYSPLFAS